jgi:hypothetical protein
MDTVESSSRPAGGKDASPDPRQPGTARLPGSESAPHPPIPPPYFSFHFEHEGPSIKFHTIDAGENNVSWREEEMPARPPGSPTRPGPLDPDPNWHLHPRPPPRPTTHLPGPLRYIHFAHFCDASGLACHVFHVLELELFLCRVRGGVPCSYVF